MALAGLLTGSAAAQQRIGTIDLGRVFDGYWKTRQAQAVLKERQADMEKEMRNMIDDLKKAKEELDKLNQEVGDLAVSPEERDRRKAAAEEKLKYLKTQDETIAQYQKQARVTLEEQRRRMRENLLTEIRSILNARAKAQGYAMVIDSAAESINQTPVLIYNTGENDITKDVLTELNSTAPPGADTSEPKKEEKK